MLTAVRSCRSTALVAALAAAIVTGGGAPALAQDPIVTSPNDTQAPVVHGFTVSPTTIDVRNGTVAVTVTVRATDDLSGVTDPDGSGPADGQVNISFRSQSGEKTKFFVFRDAARTSGSTRDGLYTIVTSFDSQTENGTWTLSGISAKDAVGNAASYEATATGPRTLQVTSNADALKPEVTALRISPQPLDVSAGDASPQFEADVTDVGAGAAQVSAFFRSPSGRQGFRLLSGGLKSGTKNDGTLAGTIYYVNDAPDVRGAVETAVSQFSEPGVYELQWIQISDFANNVRTYSKGTAAFDAITRNAFEIASNPVDVTKPTLEAFRLSPAGIDVTAGPKDVTVSFDVAEDMAGVRSAWIQLRSPQNLHRTAASFVRLTSPAVTGGTLTGKVTFPRYDHAGAWTIYSACVVDWVEWRTCYSGTELSKRGPVTLDVTVNEPPVVKVVGPASGVTYAWGAEPAATCSVTDKEDGTKTGVQPTLGELSATSTRTVTCSYTDAGGKTGTDAVTYTVGPRPNTPPAVSVTGVTQTRYAIGSEPVPGCSVVDAEDVGESASPVVTRSALADGEESVQVVCSYTDGGGLPGSQSVTYTTYNPNTAPDVKVTGVSGMRYPMGSEPTPGCSVVDAEDTGESASPVVTREAGADGAADVTVTCSYTDAGGLTGTDTVTYTVYNTAPVVTVTGVTETRYPIGGEPTPGCDVVDAEDVGESAAPAVTRTASANGEEDVRVACSYTDAGGLTGTDSVTYTVFDPNTPPTVTVTGVTGGATYEIGSVPPAGCRVTDKEDGSPVVSPGIGEVTGPLAPYGLGTQTVTCHYTDSGGLRDTQSVTYTITDTGAPALTGEPTTKPNSAGWYRTDVTIRWVATDGGAGIDPAAVPGDDQLTKEGTRFTTSASVTDRAGNTASATSAPSVNIDKTAPVLGTPTFSANPKAVTASSQLTIATSDNLSGVAAVEYFLGGTDPGQGKATAATLDAGTATVSIGTSLPAGVHTVTLRAQDRAGNWSAPTSATLVVYDPSGGFVTGGGWIDSPAGAYASDRALAGRVYVGLVSRYQKGATVPTGSTELQFRAAGLNFHSNSQDWLVVSGARAQYKGAGTLNGQSGYTYVVTLTDGQTSGGGGTDKVRMQILRDGVVVYDNVPGAGSDLNHGTPLVSGNVAIQK